MVIFACQKIHEYERGLLRSAPAADANGTKETQRLKKGNEGKKAMHLNISCFTVGNITEQKNYLTRQGNFNSSLEI